MTADWARLPYEVLASISTRIINEVKGVNRVGYDFSDGGGRVDPEGYKAISLDYSPW